MYVLANQLQNLPIISLQTGSTVAMTSRPIINPDKLEFVAFYCYNNRSHVKATILLIKDIRQITKDGIAIDSVDEIEEPGEIIRLSNLLKNPFNLIGISVVNESGVKLGRVEEYTVNLETFQIQKIYLKQSILKNLMLNSVVIDRSQIIEVNHKQILVRDATVTKSMLSSQPISPPAP